MNQTLSDAERKVDHLLEQYQDYLRATNRIDELKSDQMALAIKLGQEAGKSFAVILQEQPEQIRHAAEKVDQAVQEQQRISDEMTFANPVVWMMYKYKAYAGTSTAIVDMEDFRNHCRPEGYICTNRYHFLRNYILEKHCVDLNDLTAYPTDLRLDLVYTRPEITAAASDPKFMKQWDKHEYYTEKGRVAKWENYARHTAHAVVENLPPTLSRAAILKANSAKVDINRTRTYHYLNYTFTVPPNVFEPGGTSRFIHDGLVDGSIPLAGRTYLVMGVGVGVEPIIAAHAGATKVFAYDIDEPSVVATREHYTEYGLSNVPLIADTSDLFQVHIDEDRGPVDVITFNGPAVSVPISSDPHVVRNTSVGKSIIFRFADEIKSAKLLNPMGKAYFVISNTAELTEIVLYLKKLGFEVYIEKTQTYGPPYEDVVTFLFSIANATA
jgi:release factor glutamine methyltransferase